MSLKQLRLNKELELKRSKLDEFLSKEAELAKRSEELAATLEEAKTEEDIQLVTEEIDKLEAEQKENDEAKAEVEAEIDKLEGELEDVAQRSIQPIKQEKREKGVTAMNKLQVREMLKSGEYYERSEVKDFYEKFKNLRQVTGGELTIPEIVVNRIMDIVGDFTTIYPLVDKLQAKGTARILIDTDTEAATWLEMRGSLADKVGDVGTITDLDFDGFKVGKVTFVDNAMLQDSIINLDNYVVKKLARSIAKALDLAILHGEGAEKKQPKGIIPSLPSDRQVTIANPMGYADLAKPLALIDTGKDTVGSFVAVMNRATYYNRVMQYSVQPTAAGNVVGKLPNLARPDMLGIPVVFSNYMENDQILYADFSKYTLVEREDITIESSTHVRFTEDQVGYRAKGRFDGKPTNVEGFLLLKLTFDPKGVFHGVEDFYGAVAANVTGSGAKPDAPSSSPTTETTTPTTTGTPTPTVELRALKQADVTKREDNTSDTFTVDASGNVTNSRAFAFNNDADKTVVFLPEGVNELEFKATNEKHNILVGTNADKSAGASLSISNAKRQVYNAVLTKAGGGLTNLAIHTQVSNAHTYQVGNTYKVVNSPTEIVVSAYDADTQQYTEWFKVTKSSYNAIQWHTPRLGAMGGISPSSEGTQTLLGEAKIKAQ